MALRIYATIETDGPYPAVMASDVEMPDGRRLSQVTFSGGGDGELEPADLARITALEQQYVTMNGQSELFNVRVTEQERQVAAQSETIAALTETDAAVAEQISSLQEKDNAIDQQLANLGEQDTALGEQIGTLGEQIASLGEKDTAIEEQIAAQGEQISDMASQGETMATDIAGLKQRFADMDYGEGLKLSSFRHTAGNQEKGSVITSLDLVWSYEKGELLTRQELDGVELDLSERNMHKDNLNITMDKSTWPKWTLTATDTREKVVTGTVNSFTFLNRVYYGTATDPGEITSDFIKGLQYKPLSSGKYTPINVNAADGQYIWYCLPKWMGECVFVSGANKLIWEKQEFTLHVADGYDEPYYVYRSGNEGLGTQKLGVE